MVGITISVELLELQ